MKPRSRKAKGSKFERKVMDFFNSLPGWKARKQPGSGIYQAFPHDVFAEFGEHQFIVECKKHKHGWRTGDRQIGQADFLCIERDYGEPMIYMSARVFAQFPWDNFLTDDELNKLRSDAETV